MDPVLKHKWVEALRSGKYQQTKGVLYDGTGNKYCCLGVLLELDGYRVDDFHDKGRPRYFIRPDHYFPDYKETFLAELNDDGSDFKTIADIIEKDEWL